MELDRERINKRVYQNVVGLVFTRLLSELKMPAKRRPTAPTICVKGSAMESDKMRMDAVLKLRYRRTAEGVEKRTKIPFGSVEGVELVFCPFDCAMHILQELNTVWVRVE